MLRRFWFRFRKTDPPTMLTVGCGITAYDLSDARKILSDEVFPTYGVQSIEAIVQDIDVSTLDEKHVRPNMGNPAVRGVWFPLL